MKFVVAVALAMFVSASVAIAQSHTPKFTNATKADCIGTWAFELPDGNPAWLNVHDEDGELAAELLWSVGSARPVRDVLIDGDTITFKRRITWKPFGDDDNLRVIDTPISARVDGNSLHLYATQRKPDDSTETLSLVGRKMPPMPQRPKLAAVKYGMPITLFDGQSLSGWRLTNTKKLNGWRAKGGVLINETPKTDFGAYGIYGNLRTEEEFEDFRLTIEYDVPPGGNSGVYLRGMYEAQVVDRESRMQGGQGPGAIFGRIAPSRNAGHRGGEWNRYVLTLVDRHVTVELNDEIVIDNQPLIGCTGGGISADDTKPGPIMLQGDHTSVRYRNIVLEPVIRKVE